MRAFLLTFLLIGFTCAEISLDNAPDIDIDDVAVIKDRCDKKGGPGTYDKLKKAKDEVVPCVKNLINVDAIKNEVEEAKKTGSMDEVFGKYCNKRPEIKACVNKVVDASRPCLEDNEKDALNTTMDILNQLGEFICYRDGDRIAMFIAEGGVECIKSRIDGIKKCVNETLKVNTENLSINNLPNLTIDKKKCNDLSTVQTCIVEDLEKCKDSTPANIVDALFKFIKKNACKNAKSKRSVMSHLEHIQEAVKNQMRQLCEEEKFQDFEIAYDNSTSCIKNLTSWNNTEFKNCTENLVKATELCLPEEYKWWPEFLINVPIRMTNFLQNLSDVLKTNALYHCLSIIKYSNGQEKWKTCFQEQFNIDNGIHDLKNKQEICKKIDKTLSCAEVDLRKTCPPDILIDRLLSDFRDSLMGAC